MCPQVLPPSAQPGVGLAVQADAAGSSGRQTRSSDGPRPVSGSGVPGWCAVGTMRGGGRQQVKADGSGARAADPNACPGSRDWASALKTAPALLHEGSPSTLGALCPQLGMSRDCAVSSRRKQRGGRGHCLYLHVHCHQLGSRHSVVPTPNWPRRMGTPRRVCMYQEDRLGVGLLG